MDPLSALSVAAAVIQFVDFGTKLLTTSVEIYKSPSGRTAKEVNVSTVLGDLTSFAEHAKEAIARAPTRNKQPPNQDELLCPILAEIDSIVQDFEDPTNTNTFFARSISRLHRRGGLKKKSIAGVLISGLNASITDDMLSRLEHIQRRVMQFALYDIWVESRNSRRRELDLKRTMDDLVSLVRQIVGRTDGGDISPQDPVSIEDQVLGAMISPPGQKSIYTELIDHLWTRTWKPDEGDPGETDPAGSFAVDERGNDFHWIVIQSLEFEAIQSREDAIVGAFDKTFRWVMDTTPSSNGKPSFPVWLAEDTNDPFWITGKPGSGKSTLMKHILHDPQWTARLETWADGLPLLVISYYAWIAGAELQKSLQGLLQTILFQCLQWFPALVTTVAPRRWALLATTGGEVLPEWPLWELEESLNTLLHECGKTLKIAVFIDGLDEFRTAPAELMSLVQKLCSHTGVKVTVASREWPEFRDAFCQYPMLRMQDLTEDDMVLFVNSHFESTRGYHELSRALPAEAAALKNDVVRRANGVFLWLSLVVKSLVESLADGKRLSELQTIVDGLPGDVAELYDAIWKSIKAQNITTASELIAIVCAAREPLSYLDVWLGQREESFSPLNFALNITTAEDEPGILDIMKRRVSSNTRGILEVSSNGTIDFLHRTARDWVAKPGVWENICSHVSQEFDANLIILTGKALGVKTLAYPKPKHNIVRLPQLRVDLVFLGSLLLYASMVKESCTNSPKLVKILDLLNTELCRIISLPSEFPKLPGIPMFAETPPVAPPRPGLPLYDRLVYYHGGPLKNPILGAAAQACILPYLKAKSSRSSSLRTRARISAGLFWDNKSFEDYEGTARVSLLENAVLGAEEHLDRSIPGVHSVPLATRLKTVAFLLERGAWGRQTAHNGSPIIKIVRKLEAREDDEDRRKYWQDVEQLLRANSGFMKGLKAMIEGTAS